ncbi:MAG: hypothetical protein JW781_09410 [Deltaproteobacteria bacterium]|nr:hypothetical protein [Candidatus Anaeroferrophillacea bacterium]
MRVRNFTGVDIGRVMQDIKRELGPDAVILETRYLGADEEPAGGVEVAAAVDYPEENLPSAAAVTRRYGEVAASSLAELVDDRFSGAARPVGLDGGWQREIRDLKRMVGRLLETTGALGDWHDDGVFTAAFQRLAGAGLDDEYSRRLLDEAAARLPPAGRRSMLQVQGFLARRIIDALPLLDPASLPRRIVLVGPTGVGKTTTVAKLAAFFRRRFDERVGILSVDTFRLGAADQIRAYGRRLEMPVAVVDSHAGFVQAAAGMADRERLIVDTTGRSHRDEAGLTALHQVLPGGGGAVLLVLPAAVHGDDLLDILVQYRRFRPAAMLYTKLDETTRYGSLVSGTRIADLPLSFFATGQLVPEDLEVASGERVAGLLLGLDGRG